MEFARSRRATKSSGIVVALPFDLARVSFVGHIRLRFNTRLRSKICSESDVAMSAEGANARQCTRRGASARAKVCKARRKDGLSGDGAVAGQVIIN